MSDEPGPCVICAATIYDYDQRRRPICDACEDRYTPRESVSCVSTSH